MNRSSVILIALMVLFVISCDSGRVYESDYDFEDQSWNMDVMPSFEFQVDEISNNDLILKIRNSLDFPFRNCYMTYYLEDSIGNTLTSDLVNFQLFDETTGKPFGKGNSVFQHSETILSQYDFPSPGMYRLKVAQYMRKTDLEGTYSVGLRIEKSDQD
ncbi:gliding motility lipoprotein GldH [Roseivirga sp. E12]|uniref:gliding motility lipoprotein GldH n=1 Tax=Roseivirga sp. E12 TaxID=2819237 RepID=UPI001ABBF993|nr:gliding motility lipoprotein GldH [Roseivirga sp. E12]MBO3699146.1 gliding motility lipoprotein GldH [Roseivirga sp. E12]